MFRSPIQPAEPFSFWSPSPSPYTCRQSASPYSYAYHDPLSLAIMQQRQHEEEQAAARRQQAAVMQRRRAAAAYEAQLRKKELARRRAQQEAAAEAEYKAALVDRIMRAYATQHQQEQQAEEEDIEQEELPSQSRMIPIASFESDNESEVSSEEDETCDTTASNTSSHVPETARDQPKITYEEAVNIIHKHAQIAITIRQRLRSLNKIRSNFQSQQRSFRPPRTLDFDIPKSRESGQPTLAYTSNNRPLQAYEESLLRLLTDLDDIPSGGYTKVKKERKALARDIQSELDRVDSYKVQMWQGLR